MTIYQELKSLGVEINHHETDLYCPDTEVVRKVIKRRRGEGESLSVSHFRNQIDGKRWLDLAFRYDPAWEQKRGYRS